MTESGTKPCPMCGEHVKAEALLCRFCKHDFRAHGMTVPAAPAPAPRRNTLLIVAAVVLAGLFAVAVLGVIAAIAIPGLLAARRVSQERQAASMLRTISIAQADFHASDRDQNGVGDYWTADVYALYGLTPLEGARPIELIRESLATSDGASCRLLYVHARRGPTHESAHARTGYVFRAFGRRGEEPLRVDTDGAGTHYPAVHHESRFAFAALPQNLSRGRCAYVVTEDGATWAFQLDSRYALLYTPMTAATDSASGTVGAFGFAGPHSGECPAELATSGARRLD